jgi:undecaprenyl-diphosphatase
MENHSDLTAAFLGLVQGLTEFLPVSSSAHLLAFERILDFKSGLAFDVALHLATLAAVLIYFAREIAAIARGPNPWRIAFLLVLGTVPIGLVGYFFREFREGISPWFAVGGWCFSAAYLVASRGRSGRLTYPETSPGRVLGIGAAQALALFPGVSRSGASITAGVWLGLAREEAAKLSFLLAIPAMLGAGALEVRKLLSGSPGSDALLRPVLIGAPIAFAVGMVAIHWLLRIVKTDRFHRFGWYNLAAAAAFAAYLIVKG